jgi:parvulin-like peptidyl-prolyl isomerase
MADRNSSDDTKRPPNEAPAEEGWEEGEDTSPGGPDAKRAASGTDSKPEIAKASETDDGTEREEEDEEEDESDEEEDQEDEEEDESDEEEDQEDEEEDEETEGTRDRRHAARPAKVPVSVQARSESEDWIPDWAPWAVLIGLCGVGVLGAFGVLPIPGGGADAAHASAAETPTASGTGTPTPTPAGQRALPGARPGQAGPLGPSDVMGQVIEARHLLVQYQGAASAPPTIVRSKEDARKRAMEALTKIKAGQPFEKIVGDYSDEPGAAARGGRLGRFTKDRMVKPFADAAFALKPGELSGIVETQFGFHVIQRTQ